MKENKTQHEKILDIHSDGQWHCSTEIEYIRDQRKRISELNAEQREKTGYDMFEAISCDGRCGKTHNSRLFMRRLNRQKQEEEKLYKEKWELPKPEKQEKTELLKTLFQ